MPSQRGLNNTVMASSETEWTQLDPTQSENAQSDRETKIEEPARVSLVPSSSIVWVNEPTTSSPRGKWSRKIEFTLSCLGFAVGLGNVWRFPYMCYKNGGGAFFVPYFIMLFTVGMPLYFLELTLGQFTSQGGITCWQYAPIFQGVGMAAVLVSGMVSINYNVIMAWIFYYLFASFTDYLPWTECADPWQSATCGQTDSINGSKPSFPAEDFFNNQMLGKSGKSLDNFGELKWQLLLCLLLAWIITALCISKGIKSAGKVAYVSTLLPYICLTILLINGLISHSDGALTGMKFYITPDISRLSDSLVWKDAAVQIFFSVGLSQGCITTLASYNDLRADIFTNVLFIPIGNCLTSIFAGFVIFTYIGILADKVGLDVDSVTESGPGLAFVIYPTAVTYLPYPPFWSILFFLMMFSLGINSEYVLVESVLTGIKDFFPQLRKHTFRLVVAVCLFFFTLGIPYCFEGGIDLFDIVDNYATGWNSLIIGLMLSLTLSHVYGIDRYLDDVTYMLGDRRKVCRIPWRYWRILWTTLCGFITPAMLLFVLAFTWIVYQRPLEHIPAWGDGLGWIITSSSILSILGTMVIKTVRAKGSFIKRMHTLATPTDTWGPDDEEDKSEWLNLCKIPNKPYWPSLSRWLEKKQQM